jgi:hypothetical protein
MTSTRAKPKPTPTPKPERVKPLPTKKVKQIVLSGKKQLPDMVARKAHAAAEKVKSKTRPPVKKPRTIAETAARVNQLRDELTKLQEELTTAGIGDLGRPTLYRSEFAERAFRLCLLGYTNEELARSFGTDLINLEQWIREVPDFAWAIYDGRDNADSKVINALYEAALGFEHPEDDIRTVALGGNAGSEIVITKTTKKYPPNFSAAAMWLHNRQGRRWKAVSSATDNPDRKTPAEMAREVQEAIAAANETTPQRDEGS